MQNDLTDLFSAVVSARALTYPVLVFTVWALLIGPLVGAIVAYFINRSIERKELDRYANRF